jgi:isoleucyl-tRNA synthetase
VQRQLQAVQSAVAAGDYVINQDGSLQAAGVVVHPDEYSYRMTVADQGTAVAAEGSVVVLLDTIRNDRLWLEGDARDLNRTIQDLLKRARLRYSDRILLSISGLLTSRRC